jgi:hypothetical protein
MRGDFSWIFQGLPVIRGNAGFQGAKQAGGRKGLSGEENSAGGKQKFRTRYGSVRQYPDTQKFYKSRA